MTAGLIDLALASVSLLEPVYLYVLGYTPAQIMLFYVGVYGLYVLLVPFGGKIIGRLGYERCIALATPFFIGYYASLFAMREHPQAIVAAIICYALQKMLYWPAYDADFASASDRRSRGRSISSYGMIQSLVYMAGPLLGGIVAELWGFPTLFAMVSVLFLLANVPMLWSREVWAPIAFSYRAFIRYALRPRALRTLGAYLGFGEELIVLGLWPVFIFIIIGDYSEFGAFVAASAMITMLAMAIVGKWTDAHAKRGIIRRGTAAYVVTWLLRLFVHTGPTVFFTDALSRITKNALYIPLLALTYENAEDEDILGSVVFYEWALAAGKLLAAFLAFVILSFFDSFGAAFLVAAGMTLLYLLL